MRRRSGALLGAAAVATLLCAPSPALAAAGPAVSVYPIPGGKVASPHTQITFRGLPASQLGSVVVTGSSSGPHPGTIVADSDGRGGSFIPAGPFKPSETVTVATALNIVGAPSGSYSFTIANPAGPLPANHWPRASRAKGDVQRFHSRLDLAPARVTAKQHGSASPGDVFLAPQWGPVEDGPMIVDASGHVVWFDRLLGDDSAADFRVQTYQGRPVLTWWQGYVTAGVGVGEGVIDDSSYRTIAIVHGGNGLASDLHEFELTSRGTALLTAYYPVYWDASTAHGSRQEIVLDSVVQEIDIPTGLVLWQWDSLDHVPVSDSYAVPPKSIHSPFDYFHANSIEPDKDGKLVISARNTWAVYKVDPLTGATIWELGGKHSSFRLARGVRWAFQHDVRVRAFGDEYVTMFDDGAGPPSVEKQSRGLKLVLDLRHMTARQVAQHVHNPSLSANFEGNFQQLPDHHDFLGWGQQPYFTEYDTRGRLVLDGRFVGGVPSYRAYKFSWTGTPATKPAVATSTRRGITSVYASWNGATTVAAWRVIGGASLAALRPVRALHRSGFETTIRVRGPRYVAVQALDAAGRVLATSETIAVH